MLKAKETRFLKLNNRNKSEFLHTNVNVSVDLQKLRAWSTLIVFLFLVLRFSINT